MNDFVLTLKDNWIRLLFNHFEVRLKGNDMMLVVYLNQLLGAARTERFFGPFLTFFVYKG